MGRETGGAAHISKGYTRALARTAPVAPAVAFPQGPIGTGLDMTAIPALAIWKTEVEQEQETAEFPSWFPPRAGGFQGLTAAEGFGSSRPEVVGCYRNIYCRLGRINSSAEKVGGPDRVMPRGTDK